MKTLRAKRIAALAATLLMGASVAASGVTFGNIPIINSQGQPVVQIVVGSTSWPSDGVVAGNIAAVIGNLAFTSTNVTATVGGTSGLSCVVTTATCTLTNQQVYFNEHGLAATPGSYVFSALIGSVLNGAVQLSQPASTKFLQGSGTYTYQATLSQTPSVGTAPSPYTTGTAATLIPPGVTPSASTSGGGISFGGFTLSSTYDNLLELTSTQLPSLLSNYGGNSESTYLWITGYPVYDQQSGVNNFQLMGAGGAWQAVFSKPIQNRTGSNSVNINVPIRLLGQNWTILNMSGGGSSTVGSTSFIVGGTTSRVTLASSLTPLQTIYVGQNVSSGAFKLVLQDLGQPNASGLSPASIAVYYNGALTNESSLKPGSLTRFNVSGQNLYVKVNQTFAGLYAYQKWAKLQLYNNVQNITSTKKFNSTTAPGWYVDLWWTNTTLPSGGKPDALYSIVVYNETPVTLNPGQSFTWIQGLPRYKETFVGDTLGTNFDAISATISQGVGSQTYANPSANSLATVNSTAVTEPASLLTVSSSIPGAFQYAGPATQQVVYDLTPYQLNENANAVAPVANQFQQGSTGAWPFLGTTSNAVLTYNNANGLAWFNNGQTLQVQVQGYTTANQFTTLSATFTSNSQSQLLSQQLYNVTAVQLINRALPGFIEVNVISASTSNSANAVLLASLTNYANPLILYSSSAHPNYLASVSSGSTTVTYNQQNGQPTESFTLKTEAVPQGQNGMTQYQYFTYNIPEQAVGPTNSLALDAIGFGIVNSTAGITAASGQLFQLNYSMGATTAVGTKNNATYTGSTTPGAQFGVSQGFRTERGSKVAQISPDQLTFDYAEAVDQLQFVASVATTNQSTTNTKVVGPVGPGQAIPGVANVTVKNVSATCSVGGSVTSSSCTVAGVGNLMAMPSVTQAVVPVKLNTAVTPLVVLDTNANNASTLIVVGSKYVNTVAQQIFAQNPSLASTFGPGSVVVQAFGGSRILVAGYTANQTVQAGNQFIQQLLSSA